VAENEFPARRPAPGTPSYDVRPRPIGDCPPTIRPESRPNE